MGRDFKGVWNPLVRVEGFEPPMTESKSVVFTSWLYPIKLVRMTGLEPAASWSQTKHSTKLSYIRIHLTIAVLYIKLRVAHTVEHLHITTVAYTHLMNGGSLLSTAPVIGWRIPTLAVRSPGIPIGISLSYMVFAAHLPLIPSWDSVFGQPIVFGISSYWRILRCTNTMTTIEGVIQPYSRLPLIYINSISNTVEPYIISGHRVYEKESRKVWSNTVPSSSDAFGFQGRSIWFGTMWYSMMVGGWDDRETETLDSF